MSQATQVQSRLVPKPSTFQPSRESTLWADKIRTEIRSGIEIAGKERQGGNARGFHAQVARHMGWSSQQLTHRLAGDYQLSLEELGEIILFLDAPPGWPLIDWRTAKAR